VLERGPGRSSEPACRDRGLFLSYRKPRFDARLSGARFIPVCWGRHETNAVAVDILRRRPEGGGSMRRVTRKFGITLVASAAMFSTWAAGIPAAQAAGASCNGKPATIVGTPGPDKIRGTQGRDVIQALAGDDQITGLGGDDLICGKSGNDQIMSGRGMDKVFAGVGMDAISGSRGRDRLWGNDGSDQLSGQTGNDWLFGGGGFDQGNGGAGVDVCRNVEQRVSC
jgi:hypothetical protein